MRILHTADWHLGDRLGRIDRTDDLRRAVERIAEYCRTESIDVLLMAGDLFSELARPDALRDAIRHLQETFGAFLSGGGTIVALTGNHDNENFCQTLWHAMSLASPAGGAAATGRLHLATSPTLLRLPDRTGPDVQFLLMPFPTPNRYFDEPATRYGSFDEKNRQLISAFTRKLQALRDDPRFDKNLQTILSAHLSVTGGQVSPLFRISEPEDLVLPNSELAAGFAYVALGHIHRPQSLTGHPTIRYAGSIERLDLGEKNDAKSIVAIEVGPRGLLGEPVELPLPATPIYELDVNHPAEQVPLLAERFPDSQRDLVNLHITYTAGTDNLEEVLRELEKQFPRWYARDWQETSALGPALTVGGEERSKSFGDTVRDYLHGELTNYAEAERTAVLDHAEELLRTMDESP